MKKNILVRFGIGAVLLLGVWFIYPRSEPTPQKSTEMHAAGTDPYITRMRHDVESVYWEESDSTTPYTSSAFFSKRMTRRRS